MNKSAKLILILLIATAGIGCAVYYVKVKRPDEEMRAAVSSHFKDPESAKFRIIKKTRQIICGEVNAKNSYGAYEGYKRFVYIPSSKTVSYEPDNTISTDSDTGQKLKESIGNLFEITWDICT
tara:strand:+ start:150 stop:518 length:369 start_codon:yes stop_codon:yes gene_type:complete